MTAETNVAQRMSMNDDAKTWFQGLLKAILRDHNCGYPKLARMLDVSERTVYGYMSGERMNPTLDIVAKVVALAGGDLRRAGPDFISTGVGTSALLRDSISRERARVGRVYKQMLLDFAHGLPECIEDLPDVEVGDDESGEIATSIDEQEARSLDALRLANSVERRTKKPGETPLPIRKPS